MNVQNRLKWASWMIGAGIMVQIATLLVLHPLAFVAFIAISGPLLVGGVLLYLFTLVSGQQR